MSRKSISLEPFPWMGLSPQPVVGVDEVGRGCLAGPVYAAAVILPQTLPFNGLTDSKKISEKRREQLSLLIQEHCQVSIGLASVEEIDRMNILWASLLAMHRAVSGLGLKECHVIVDGNQKIPDWPGPQTPVVKGDFRAEPIAAASIVAKVHRDQVMKELGKIHPGYGLEDHKGYATKVHKQAIADKGPRDIHRKSFAGVREHLSRFPQGTYL